MNEGIIAPRLTLGGLTIAIYCPTQAVRLRQARHGTAARRSVSVCVLIIIAL